MSVPTGGGGPVRRGVHHCVRVVRRAPKRFSLGAVVAGLALTYLIRRYGATGEGTEASLLVGAPLDPFCASGLQPVAGGACYAAPHDAPPDSPLPLVIYLHGLFGEKVAQRGDGEQGPGPQGVPKGKNCSSDNTINNRHHAPDPPALRSRSPGLAGAVPPASARSWTSSCPTASAGARLHGPLLHEWRLGYLFDSVGLRVSVGAARGVIPRLVCWGGRGRIGQVELRLEPRPVRLSLHDEVVSRVFESVHRAYLLDRTHLGGIGSALGIAFPGSTVTIPNMRTYNTPIAAKGRIFVAADGSVVAFTP